MSKIVSKIVKKCVKKNLILKMVILPVIERGFWIIKKCETGGSRFDPFLPANLNGDFTKFEKKSRNFKK